MSGIGDSISKKARVRKNGQMGLNIMEAMNKDLSRGLVNAPG